MGAGRVPCACSEGVSGAPSMWRMDAADLGVATGRPASTYVAVGARARLAQSWPMRARVPFPARRAAVNHVQRPAHGTFNRPVPRRAPRLP